MHRFRRSGILLHPTSLSGPDGIGTLGKNALDFVDFLHGSGQTLWQILPLGPPGCGNSPYSCFSAFAGNPLLIDLEEIVSEGDLETAELTPHPDADRIDFNAVSEYKLPLLMVAAKRFFSSGINLRMQEFWDYCDSTFWLHDYALFMALKANFKGKSWNRWPEKLASRDPEACRTWSEKLGEDIGFQKYLQWQVAKQWHRVKSYANERGVLIVGDAPIFVAHDSADVWCNQHLFRLDASGTPYVVAGVPPDYFSKTGQRWGNPVYDWEALDRDNYGWWSARIRNDLFLYDILRIDHFRGFEACWEIPAKEKTAVKGEWVKGPGTRLFKAVRSSIGNLPIIAEDLGIITHEVEALRDSCGFPGMRILQFAFDGGGENSYLPHNHIKNSVVYTGTHDNDTTRGWLDSLGEHKKRHICEYLDCSQGSAVEKLLRTAMASVAGLCVIPLQDVLQLDCSARMNIPGVAEGNWGWRVQPGYAESSLMKELRRLSALYNRNGQQ
jgi:4-alpha-glucanotransferase